MTEEQLKVVIVTGDSSVKDWFYQPLLDILARQVSHEVILVETGNTDRLKESLGGSDRILWIVSGYSFTDKPVAALFAAAIENGLRLLVLDPNLHNKHLAERLGITNIKHKVRIEPMSLTDWTEDKERILEAVLRDELSRFV